MLNAKEFNLKEVQIEMIKIAKLLKIIQQNGKN